MIALAINGSPRPNGNTRIMLETVIEPLAQAGWETEIYQLGGKAVHGCTHCTQCRRTLDKKCIISSDCINDIIGKMDAADAIIIGSPTYFANVSTEVKALIDRAGFVGRGNGNMFKGKIGSAVSAVRRAGAIHAVEAIYRMYLICGMVIPGSTYFNHAIGFAPGESAGDAEGMGNMRNLGQAIKLLGEATAPFRNAWPG